MKTILTSIIALIALTCYSSAPPSEPGWASASRLTISPFAATREYISNSKADSQLGGGLALQYSLSESIAIEGSALSYKVQDDTVLDTIDEATINLKSYIMLGNSGLAPYGIIGYSRDVVVHDNLLNLGGGLSYNYKRFQVFADGQYRLTLTDADRGNQLMVRLGLGIRLGK
jgi:hypothetical protein